MKKAEFTLEIIKDNRTLGRLGNTLASASVIAFDIETTEWWNRHREKIALVQFAYRHDSQAVKVAVIDAFAALDFDLLRAVLEAKEVTKIVHNQAFDVPRLAKHYAIKVAPVFDTMRAARFNGERKYSLSAQAMAHLNLSLDKSFQKTDWSRRPLAAGQLYYAAIDAYAALLLYENQIGRGLTGGSQRPAVDERQVALPLVDSPETSRLAVPTFEPREVVLQRELSDLSLALLGIVAELPTRYSPDGLAATVAVGSERVGLAGWIIDRRLGAAADLDEATVKLTIAELCAGQMLQTNETRRLIATDGGIKLWQKFRND